MTLVGVLLYLSLGLSVFPLLIMMQSLNIFLPWLFAGLLGGFAAATITGYRPGLLNEILIGLAGYALGGAAYSLATRHSPGGPLTLPSILAGTAGAVVVMMVLHALRSAGADERAPSRRW